MGSVVRSIYGFLPKPLTTTSHKGRFGHSGSLTDPLEEMPKTASSMKREAMDPMPLIGDAFGKKKAQPL
jgi:hypothetical protein